jgi:hypothetical protein
MHVGFKIAIGAGLLGAGALALAACGNKQEHPIDDSDVLGAADRATGSDSSMNLAYQMATNSGRPAAEAVSLLGTADRVTGSDSSMLQALRLGLQSSLSASEFRTVAEAADRATGSDSGTLMMLDLAAQSSMPADRIAQVFANADRATGSDSAAINVAHTDLLRYENTYPAPGEVPSSGGYPTGGTSGGDE